MVVMFTVPSSDFIAAAYVSTACMAVVGYLALRAHLGILGTLPAPSLDDRPRSVDRGPPLPGLLRGQSRDDRDPPVRDLHIERGLDLLADRVAGQPPIPPGGRPRLRLRSVTSHSSGASSRPASSPRLGLGSVFLVALVDASLHVITLNPLWVVTTFIADSVWGLTYYYSKDLTSSVTSHFVWDVVIFLVLPDTIGPLAETPGRAPAIGSV